MGVRDAGPPEMLLGLQGAAQANHDDVLRYGAEHDGAGTMGDGVGKELCCRDGDRYDVHFRMSDEPFAAPGARGAWCAAVRAILGDDAHLLHTGLIVACGCDPEVPRWDSNSGLQMAPL